MTSRIKLNLPKVLPVWATDVGSTVEPVAGLKASGWNVSKRPAARKLNWLFNTQYEWSKRFASLLPLNWVIPPLAEAGNGVALVYSEPLNIFVSVESRVGVPYSMRSNDGSKWTTGDLFGGSPSYPQEPSFNSSHILVGCNSGKIRFSANGFSWAEEDNGSVESVQAIDTKYPDSDLIITGSAAIYSPYIPRIRRAVSGIGGGWATPTTMPTVLGGISSIIHAYGSTWYGFSMRGHAFKSSDDGDNWTNLTNGTPFSSSSPCLGVDYNPDTGTLVAVGHNSTNYGRMYYTHDDGATAWKTPVIEDSPLSERNPPWFARVKYCGSGFWIVAGTWDGTTGLYPFTLLVSQDDGETWKYATLIGMPALSADVSVGGLTGSRKMLLLQTSIPSYYPRSLTV